MIINYFSKTEHNIINIWIYDIRESVHTRFTRSVLERRVFGQFLGFTGVLELEGTPLLTAHQPVSWSSPGLTSGRTLHRVSLMWMKWMVYGFYWLATWWQHSSVMQAGLLSGEQLCNPSLTEINLKTPNFE